MELLDKFLVIFILFNMIKFKRVIFLNLIIIIGIALNAGIFIKARAMAEEDSAQELKIYTLHLDKKTILKGYTFVAPNKDFKVGVVDKAVKEPVTVRFKQIPDSYMTAPLKKAPGRQASHIWEFDLLADDGQIGKLVKPIYLAVKLTNQTMNRKIMYFWDKGRQKWMALPSSIDLKNKLIRAVIHLPYARVALFDEPDATTYEAWASWYPTELTKRNQLGCASNVYPLNTPLWVCRLDDLSKCTITRVISRGPYVQGRVVDLTKTAFERIGNPRGGVLGVRVFLRREQ